MQAAQISPVFEALSDPTRRQVVQMLGAGPRRAGDLARAAGASPPAMSRHLRVLLRAGLVTDERPTEDARIRVFRLRPESMELLRAWLDELQAQWDEQLQAFKRHATERHATERHATERHAELRKTK
jgi:DNA-binding transcriptional ArsR family regulator